MKIKIETVGYAIFTSLAFAWFWNTRFASLSGPNPSEALGYDLFSIVPLVALVIISRKFLQSYRLWKTRSGIGVLLFVLSATALMCGGWSEGRAIAAFLALVGVGFVFGTRQSQVKTAATK